MASVRRRGRSVEHVDAERSPDSSRITLDGPPELDPGRHDTLVQSFDPSRPRRPIVPVEEAPNGSTDREPRFSFRSRPARFDVRDSCARRAAAAPLDHRLDSLVVALEHGFDGSVGVVPHPSVDPERPRPVPRLDAEEHALDRPRTTTCARFTTGEPLLADERHEAARNGVHDRRPLRAADDELEPLAPAPADGHREAAPRLELLVERAAAGWAPRPQPRSRRTALLRQPERAVADVDVDALVAGCREVLARLARRARGSARSCAPPPPARRARPPGSPSRCRRRARARRR